MEQPAQLYLFTLEVVPLEVGKTYNPLPSHLTLISRFYAHEPPKYIAKKASDLFNGTGSIALVFDQSATIGPKNTAVHLVQASDALKELHNHLSQILDSISVEYTQPEYIREGWKPHISKRNHDNFAPGLIHPSKAAYLIEVRKEGENDIRIIRGKFSLSS